MKGYTTNSKITKFFVLIFLLFFTFYSYAQSICYENDNQLLSAINANLILGVKKIQSSNDIYGNTITKLKMPLGVSEIYDFRNRTVTTTFKGIFKRNLYNMMKSGMQNSENLTDVWNVKYYNDVNNNYIEFENKCGRVITIFNNKELIMTQKLIQ